MTSRPAAPPRPDSALQALRRADTLEVVRGAAAALALLSPLLLGTLPVAASVGVVVFFGVSGYLAVGHLLAPGSRRLEPGRSLVAPVLLVVLATYVVSALMAVGASVAGLAASVLPLLTVPWVLVPSALWLVVPLVLLVGDRPVRAQVALSVAGVAAVLGALGWVGGVPGGLPLVSASWAWCFVLGAALRWAEHRRARLPR